jgi:hypothetical protein
LAGGERWDGRFYCRYNYLFAGAASMNLPKFKGDPLLRSPTPLIDNGRQMPVYAVVINPREPAVQCVPRSEFELLDLERRRLRQALLDRGIDPNNIPPVAPGN